MSNTSSINQRYTDWNLHDTLPSGRYIRLVGLYEGSAALLMQIIESILIEDYSIVGSIRSENRPVFFEFYIIPEEIKPEFENPTTLFDYLANKPYLKLAARTGFMEK